MIIYRSSLLDYKIAVIKNYISLFIGCGITRTNTIFKRPNCAFLILPYFNTVLRKFLFARTCIVNFILFSVDPTSSQTQIFEINADKSFGNGGVFRSKHTYVIFKRVTFSSSFNTDITAAIFPNSKDFVCTAHSLFKKIKPTVLPPLAPMSKIIVLLSDKSHCRDVFSEHLNNFSHDHPPKFDCIYLIVFENSAKVLCLLVQLNIGVLKRTQYHCTITVEFLQVPKQKHCLTVRSNYEHCGDRRRIIWIQSLHDFLLSSPKKHIIFYYFRIKKRQTSFLGLFVSFGRSDWIRTSGLLVPNQALYRTEPHPVFNFSFTIVSHVFGFVNTFSQKTRAVSRSSARKTRRTRKKSRRHAPTLLFDHLL